tara:strand:- start:339 stop:521 length:183 start_codon:yes stop_codon:yes gene_type:complete
MPLDIPEKSMHFSIYVLKLAHYFWTNNTISPPTIKQKKTAKIIPTQNTPVHLLFNLHIKS